MNDALLPGQEDQPRETMCSSCGRFVGALTRCPYCGARVTTRLSVRFFRYAALLLGTVGLGLLYVMARTQPIPRIKIADVKPTMNFAYVQIAGTVSGDARTFKEGGRIRSLRFMVDDGTGEITVNAYRSQAQALADAGRLPRLGDEVIVAGSLSVTADGDVIMRLQVPEQLIIASAEMATTPLGDIGTDMVGTSVLVEGVILEVNAPGPTSRAPWNLVVRDDTGRGQITFWKDVHEEMPDKLLLMKDNRIRARVSVMTYRDAIQLSLARAADLEFLDKRSSKPAVGKTAGPGAASGRGEDIGIAEITEDMAGRAVRIKGRVKEINPPKEPKAPQEVIVEEGDSTIAVVYWDTVAKNLRDNTPIVGSNISVEGAVGVYEGKLQIKVNHSRQIKLLDAVPTRTEAPGEPVKIMAITKAMLKQVCTVTGTLGEPRSIRGGVVYPLSDDSGEIQLVLWDRRVPGADRDKLSAGTRVTVTAEVDEYRGALQLVPSNPQNIRMEKEAAAK